MPVERRTPTVEAIITRLEARVAKLERRLLPLIDARRTPLMFSFSGPLDTAVGVESMALRPIHSTEIDLVVPQVLIAPSGGALTIDLTLYGPTTGVVRTLTIPDGSTYSEDAVPFIIPIGGSLTATITDSNGAEDLSISLIPRLL